jgi:hypothetical protein
MRKGSSCGSECKKILAMKYREVLLRPISPFSHIKVTHMHISVQTRAVGHEKVISYPSVAIYLSETLDIHLHPTMQVECIHVLLGRFC